MPIQIQNFTMSWIFSTKKKIKNKIRTNTFYQIPTEFPFVPMDSLF